MSNLKTDKDKYLILRNRAEDLVRQWTEKAQSSAITDDERFIYYECAEALHNQIFQEIYYG